MLVFDAFAITVRPFVRHTFLLLPRSYFYCAPSTSATGRLSMQRRTARDVDAGAGHVRRFVGNEPRDRLADVLGGSRPAERRGRRFFLALLPAGVGVARRDGGD